MAVEVAALGLARKRAGVTIHTVTVALFVATALAGFSALILPFVIATHFVWNAPQWHAIAAKWMGVAG